MKESFKHFMLSNNVDQISISSYYSYVKSAYEKMLPKHFKKIPNIYDRLIELTKRSRAVYCEYLLSRLNVEIASPISTISQKTLQNYKAGVTMLKRFVDSDAFLYSGKKHFNKVFAISYSRHDIIDNFVFRLETQDRIYKSKICFPCRLFGKIYAKGSVHRDKYEKMLSSAFSKAKFLVNSQRDYLFLADVERLDILGGIRITSQCGEHDVFTETFSKIAYMGCVKTNAKILEDLSLNHDDPMENIVNREIVNLPELKRLSDAFWNYHVSTKLSGTQLSTSFYNEEYKKMSINESQLLDEIIEIYKYVEFTIMDTKINSALNNKVIPMPPLGIKLN